MKKALVIFILICTINLFNPIFAAEKPSYKIKKDNGKYFVIDKKTQNIILPYKYDKIRKAKYEDKTILIAENKNYITLYSPNGIYDDFIKKYYQANKYNKNIVFKNYPDNAVIIYTQNKKSGIIAADGEFIHIVKPIFSRIDCADDISTAFRLLNISFSSYDNILAYTNYGGGNYQYMTLKDILENSMPHTSQLPVIQTKTYIDEKMRVINNILEIEYKNKTTNTNKLLQKSPVNIDEISTIEDLFDDINRKTPYIFKNYPLNGTIQTGHRLYVFQDGIGYDIVVPASDYYKQNSLISQLTGVNINFNNQNEIIARNGSWGIINKNNEVKTPFIYDAIYPLNNGLEETVSSNGNKTIIQYKNGKNCNYFLAKKGYGWGIINANNEIIVPFEYKHNKDNNEFNLLKAQINKKIQLDENREEMRRERGELPNFILELILLPLWIILPYPFSGNVNINYF